MIEVATYTETLRKNYDPTHTTGIRNSFARTMKSRFTKIERAIREAVDKKDCFGLRKIHSLRTSIPVERAFAFSRSSEKITAFMEWLEKQVEDGLLTVGEMQQIGTSIEAQWMNLYLFDSYKKGVLRARQEMRALGMNIPPIDDIILKGMLFNLPFHMDRMGLIFTRAYNDLKGITDAMDAAISRILAQGLADGDGPALLARKMVSVINGQGMGELGITDTLGRFIPAKRRAEMLARTEVIRAHHVATIQEYRNFGILGINIKAEWRTAGDGRVCDECKSLEKRIFTLDEAEGLIPLHPLCRCISLPYIEELEEFVTKIRKEGL